MCRVGGKTRGAHLNVQMPRRAAQRRYHTSDALCPSRTSLDQSWSAYSSCIAHTKTLGSSSAPRKQLGHREIIPTVTRARICPGPARRHLLASWLGTAGVVRGLPILKNSSAHGHLTSNEASLPWSSFVSVDDLLLPNVLRDLRVSKNSCHDFIAQESEARKYLDLMSLPSGVSSSPIYVICSYSSMNSLCSPKRSALRFQTRGSTQVELAGTFAVARTELVDLSGKQTRQRTLVRPLRLTPTKRHHETRHVATTELSFRHFEIHTAKDFAERILHFVRRRARRNEELAPQRLHARSRQRSSLS